jgi:hypothetical protein
MGRTQRTHRKIRNAYKISVRNFQARTKRGVDGKVMLKLILNLYCISVWTRFNYIRVRPNVGHM